MLALVFTFNSPDLFSNITLHFSYGIDIPIPYSPSPAMTQWLSEQPEIVLPGHGGPLWV